jgi:hypothetical protein
MTIYHRLKVWAIKGYRFIRFGFKQVRPRRDMAIFTQPQARHCDYCSEEKMCVVIEADYEVFPTICKSCLWRMLTVISPQLSTGQVTSGWLSDTM